MRLTILGGGGFRVPLVYQALLGDRGDGRITSVMLYDTDRVPRSPRSAPYCGSRPRGTPMRRW